VFHYVPSGFPTFNYANADISQWIKLVIIFTYRRKRHWIFQNVLFSHIVSMSYHCNIRILQNKNLRIKGKSRGTIIQTDTPELFTANIWCCCRCVMCT
jgi:hypothetical protein